MQYSWEESGHRQKAIKATGTVVFSPNEHVSLEFADCRELSDVTARVLKTKLGFERFLPAQAQVFKGITNGRDVILHSRTGSGKTLAYVLPILERFLHERSHLDDAAASVSVPAAPYLLIFVFGNELAMQTKSVILSVYGGRLSVAVAGFDDITTDTKVDVLIGTLSTVDHLLRGTDEADEVLQDAVAESDVESEDGLLQLENPVESTAPDGSRLKGKKSSRKLTPQASTTLAQRPQKKHRGAQRKSSAGVVSLARIRAIVVDEVDATLGPKFSNLGRRFKNILRLVREGNGSLSNGLANDFRMHHYVLCGATIPNWVIKAGFLGVKKYYYRLITAGDAKLPQSLECFTYSCPKTDRIAATRQLIACGKLGRTLIFTTGHRIQLVEAALKDAVNSAQEDTPQVKGGDQLNRIVIRTLSSQKDEAERISCIEDFNSGAAQVLLCTDMAARGIDFVAVETVLMETLSDHAATTENFVHRAGRSARVNNVGRTILLYDPAHDTARLAKLESVLHVRFKEFPKGGASEPQAAARLSLRVRQTLRGSRSNEPKILTPRDVLSKSVDPSLILAIHDTESPDRVEFDVAASAREDVRKALWKYDLKVL